MIKKTLAVVALLLLASSPARAGLITLVSGGALARASNPIPAGTTYAPGGTPGGGIDGGSIGFVAPYAGTLRITVTDCCYQGDVFEVILNGASLGLTTPAPISLLDTFYSSGVFTSPVLAGAGAVAIWDITLSYLGETSPFGGGSVPDGSDGFDGASFDPAGLSYSIQLETEAVPEPTTMLLLGAGLLGIGLRRRNRP